MAFKTTNFPVDTTLSAFFNFGYIVLHQSVHNICKLLLNIFNIIFLAALNYVVLMSYRQSVVGCDRLENGSLKMSQRSPVACEYITLHKPKALVIVLFKDLQMG